MVKVKFKTKPNICQDKTEKKLTRKARILHQVRSKLEQLRIGTPRSDPVFKTRSDRFLKETELVLR